MAKLSVVNFVSKWALRFADNTSQQISEADMREFSVDISDSFGNIEDSGSMAFATWNGASFPTPDVDTIYMVTADHGSLGDADYVPAGAWMIGPAGATVFANFYIKP